MCGIFGIVTSQKQTLGGILVQAGRRLSYRGYDSVGCATLDGDTPVDLRKDAGKIDQVASRYDLESMVGKRGIMQLRWATFGTPSTANSQPHLDSDGDLVGAHNGNVVNNAELRCEFVAEGMTVRSENDGESCVHAVERYYDRGHDMLDAIRLAYNDLQGDYSFVIGRVNDDKLYAFKKGSGLVAGLAEGACCVSSDLPSILPLTRRIVRILDGEIVIMTADSIQLRSVRDGSVIEREAETFTGSMDVAAKGNYPHFMLKEINEQPRVAAEMLRLLEATPNANRMADVLRHARHVYLVACGTSYNASILGSIYLARIAGRAAVPVLAPQFAAQYAPASGPDDAVILVSQSGETKDVLNALEAAEARGMHCLSLANVIGSTLMARSECYLPLACGYEISVPATKTYTNQVLAFLFLALKLAGQSTEFLRQVPEMIESTLRSAEPQVTALEPIVNAEQDLYFLGYGSTYAVALEGALKLKEIAYSHCEGILSTEFKHGPLSIVRDGYPVLFIAAPEDIPIMISGINETTCRGGRAVVFGPDDPRLRSNADDLVVLPDAGPTLTPLLAALPLQLLAYHCSVARGNDPDFPRNLSKTLTVD